MARGPIGTFRTPMTNKRKRAGWTLLEIMVVVTLIAMATAMATMNFRGPLIKTRYRAFAQRLVDVDHRLRRQCLQNNQANYLTVDCDRNEFSYTNHQGNPQRVGCPPRSQLKYWMDDSGKRSTRRVRIHYDSHGASSSFAVCITLGKTQSWLVFLGRTGECLKCSHEKQVKEIFDEAKSFRADAR